MVGASCTLEYLVPSALLLSAFPLLGHHLQHPHAGRLPRAAGHQAGTSKGFITELLEFNLKNNERLAHKSEAVSVSSAIAFIF